MEKLVNYMFQGSFNLQKGIWRWCPDCVNNLIIRVTSFINVGRLHYYNITLCLTFFWIICEDVTTMRRVVTLQHSAAKSSKGEVSSALRGHSSPGQTDARDPHRVAISLTQWQVHSEAQWLHPPDQRRTPEPPYPSHVKSGTHQPGCWAPEQSPATEPPSNEKEPPYKPGGFGALVGALILVH
ncbi:hypothetical protein AMECASPLE_037221 [Ameca splendens]|uniref:Uncharacterized protein n=1 Tax=Ameca splendens TaxID=208324 RepID=A0ABV0XKW8_9TELE